MQKTKPEIAFTDDRGEITNLLTVPLEHVAIITCNPGAIRGNHVHAEDNHYSYLIFGHATYYEKNEQGQVEQTDFLPNELIYTPAGRAHDFHFDEESAFFAFTTRRRMDGAYEEDTTPVVLIALEA